MAIEITAFPASRLEFTTPFATVSFAVSVTAPLLVVMLALIRIERPACAASDVPGLAMLTALVNVISLFACSTTFAVCALIEPMPVARIVERPPGLLANKLLTPGS